MVYITTIYSCVDQQCHRFISSNFQKRGPFFSTMLAIEYEHLWQLRQCIKRNFKELKQAKFTPIMVFVTIHIGAKQPTFYNPLSNSFNNWVKMQLNGHHDAQNLYPIKIAIRQLLEWWRQPSWVTIGDMIHILNFNKLINPFFTHCVVKMIILVIMVVN